MVWTIVVLAVWVCFKAARLELSVSAALCIFVFLGLAISLPSSPGFVEAPVTV